MTDWRDMAVSDTDRDMILGLEVLRLSMRGWPASHVGEVLKLPENAVRSRLRRLYVRLGARTCAHAVVIAGVEGLLSKADMQAAYQDRRPEWAASMRPGQAEEEEA